MGFLMLFFVLFGLGALLGLAYAGVKAIFMASRGSVWFAKGLGSSMKDGWNQAKAEHEAAQAAKAARLRERP